ncbi:cell division protein [Algibacter sp. R77976]|uniref:cell division protein n=1 Tax=Algibacter sp. R77976 TaxID=3093873 RepID=UPI0037CC1D15
MPLVKVETHINAGIQTCFDLARNVDFYQNSIKNSREIAIDGKITGLVEANDSITWEAKHLGFVRHITLKVTEFDNPNLFVDEMVHGNFKAYKHEHIFREDNNKTIMIDKFYFESPWGIIGKMIDGLFMKKYMINILKTRNSILKAQAEKKQI